MVSSLLGILSKANHGSAFNARKADKARKALTQSLFFTDARRAADDAFGFGQCCADAIDRRSVSARLPQTSEFPMD